jgi:hypothetical protein
MALLMLSLLISTLLDFLRLENLRLSGTIPEDVRNMTRVSKYSIGVSSTADIRHRTYR